MPNNREVFIVYIAESPIEYTDYFPADTPISSQQPNEYVDVQCIQM